MSGYCVRFRCDKGLIHTYDDDFSSEGSAQACAEYLVLFMPGVLNAWVEEL